MYRDIKFSKIEKGIIGLALLISAICFGVVVYAQIAPDVQYKNLTRDQNVLTIEATIGNIKEINIYLHNSTDWGGLVWIEGIGSKNSTQGIITEIDRNYYEYDEENNWVNFSYSLTINRDFKDTENTLKYWLISPYGITKKGEITIE